jgi:hypothetical protein
VIRCCNQAITLFTPVGPASMSATAIFQQLRASCRGRDDHCWSPPAQIRTCAFTHTALTEDEWRRSVCRDKDAEHEVAESTGPAAA